MLHSSELLVEDAEEEKWTEDRSKESEEDVQHKHLYMFPNPTLNFLFF
jgi:hypothetical protein